ncbi:MAG: multicopper oxidase domain-containing protein [Acidobacteriota bacterium]|nr:multicopper oxidase domain-containing protein [Acidobacteriota bacterium]
MTQLLLALVTAVALTLTPSAFAAAPGITGTPAAGTATAATFNLTAQDAYLNQPDGAAVYSWGYGCVSNPATSAFVPAAAFAFPPTCNTMQVPGPTMVVTEGATVTINLTNNLPTAAGNTSILFPGFNVTTTCTGTGQQQGLLTCEAVPGGTVTYSFTASAPGTHGYYSGTQGDLQIEMGLYGAVIVLPKTPPANCATGTSITNLYGKTDFGTANKIAGFPEQDFRLSTAAYDHPKSCYDREYLFQWAEMDSRIHHQAEAQVRAKAGCAANTMGCSLDVQTEPYHPAYFLINGRSMPDLMDPNYASEYPHQPYNGNPHMHPGEITLIRTIGQGRWQHPFHEHANHVRILARDGDLILSPTHPATSLAGSLMFNTDTTPGEAFDGIFYFSGRGLNWDPYGHHPAGTGNTSFPITALSETGNTVRVTVTGALPANLAPATSGGNAGFITISNAPDGYDGSFSVLTVTSGTTSTLTFTDPTSSLASATGTAGTLGTLNTGSTNGTPPTDPFSELSCTPDANGYNTGNPAALNYYEWCQDHNKPVQVAPFGDVASGGPATLPDPNVLTNGQWYGGTPYLGPDASLRATMSSCDTTTNANCTTLLPSNTQANPANERGWAFMWHSHNEREITTNNVFPGGMLMMMLVDSREFAIDESQ